LSEYNSAEGLAIFIQVIIALVIVRRAYAMSRGVPYSAARLAVAPGLILFLWALSELESVLLTPWALPYLIAVDSVIVVLTSLTFARTSESATVITRSTSEGWSYRIPFATALLYLTIFLARLVLAVILFPTSLELGATPSSFAPVGQQVVLAIIDAAFSVSAGLLLGRSIGVVRKMRASQQAAAAPAGTGSP